MTAEQAPPAAAEKVSVELAGIDLAKLTGRQWSGIDCALPTCRGWLAKPDGTRTRKIGTVKDRMGYRYELWAHAECPAEPHRWPAWRWR